MEPKMRKLGGNGPSVAAVGLGCMSMSHAYGPADEKEAIATIERALELGAAFLDTADFYGMGHNEMLIGKAIQGKREKAFLSVKSGVMRRPGKNGQPGFGPVNASPDYLRNAVLYSLQRLQTDYIDLYTPARVDPAVPVEETMGALAELVQEGLIRHAGLSEASAGTIARAQRVFPVTALQIEYSLWTREVEQEVLPLLQQEGIALVAYSPLSRGWLSGAIRQPEDIRDNRVMMPRFQGEYFSRNQELADIVRELAQQKGCTPAQLAIAWVLAQGDNIIAIPGTKRRAYLEENLGAMQVTFTVAELADINRLMPPGAAAGERYPAPLMKQLNG